MVDPIKFCEMLRLKNGKPLKLCQWQRDFVLAVATGQYREAFLFIPRKNGKTTLLAALAVYFLFTREQGSEIYVAAATKEQATILFREAHSMINQCKALCKKCKMRPSKKEIAYGSSFIKALSSDVRGHAGLNPSIIIADEIAFHKNRELFDILWSGQGQRLDPLCVSITTANDNMLSFAKEKYDYAKRIISGEVVDPSFYPVIYEGTEMTMDSVRAANPSIGICVQEKYLEAELQKALHDPSHETLFRWAHLNQWVSSTKAWLDQTHIANAVVSELPPINDTYTLGLDLSAVLDLSCYVAAWEQDDITYLDPHIFIPAKAAKDYEKRYGVPYKKWAREGWITIQDGNAIDPVGIRTDLQERYINPYKLLLDRWGGNETILDLSQAGYNVETMGQGYQTMSPASKEFQRLLYTGKVKWCNPILTWACSHAEICVDPAGNIKPQKPAPNSHKKIDPLVAGIMAISGLPSMDYSMPVMQWS
jgi:phage terminase large subunit-like protein